MADLVQHLQAAGTMLLTLLMLLALMALGESLHGARLTGRPGVRRRPTHPRCATPTAPARAANPVPTLETSSPGWFALWHAALHEIGFFRDLLGVGK